MASTFSSQLLQFLLQNADVGELLGGFGADLHVGRSAFFHIAQIGHAFQFDGALFQLLGEFDNHPLHQGGAADRLLHPQLAALHAARQIDFAFARQQRNGAHFAQIHAHRIVGVDGLFHRRRVQKIGFVRSFRIEELGFVLEIEA